jgi:hypothetical protein
MTTMKAAASPTIADRVMKVKIRRTGRINFPHVARQLARFRMCIMRRLPGSRSGAFARRTCRGLFDPEVK